MSLLQVKEGLIKFLEPVDQEVSYETMTFIKEKETASMESFCISMCQEQIENKENNSNNTNNIKMDLWVEVLSSGEGELG